MIIVCKDSCDGVAAEAAVEVRDDPAVLEGVHQEAGLHLPVQFEQVHERFEEHPPAEVVLLHHVLDEHVMHLLTVFVIFVELGLDEASAVVVDDVELQPGLHFDQKLDVLRELGRQLVCWHGRIHDVVAEVVLAGDRRAPEAESAIQITVDESAKGVEVVHHPDLDMAEVGAGQIQTICDVLHFETLDVGLHPLKALLEMASQVGLTDSCE